MRDHVDAKDGERIDIGWDRPVSLSEATNLLSGAAGKKKTVRAIPTGMTSAALACGGGGGNRPGAESGSAEGTPGGATAAPAPAEGFKVGTVMIGKRISDEKLITEPTFQFAPMDTVYVSVGTTGKTDSSALTAVWRFQTGQTVDSSTQVIRPDGPENTEFHISRPKGWPLGTYNVTIFADGDSVDAKNFAVKK